MVISAKRGLRNSCSMRARVRWADWTSRINHCAARSSRRPFLEADEAWINAVFDLNAARSSATLPGAERHLTERRRGGRIIMSAPSPDWNGGGPGTGIYGAFKGLRPQLTRHLAREFRRRKYPRQTVAPG